MTDSTLQRRLDQLESLTALNHQADEVLEAAQRDRMALPRTMSRMMPVLAKHTKAAAIAVRTYDEDLQLQTFEWFDADSGHIETASMFADDHATGPHGVSVCQTLDVAGEEFGEAAVLVSAPGVDKDHLAAQLNTWCEELDNYLASISQARLKQRASSEIAEALRQQTLDAGLNRAIEALSRQIQCDRLALVCRHDDRSRVSGISYKVMHNRQWVADSSISRADDGEIRALCMKALDGDLTPLQKKFELEGALEQVLIGGREGDVVGRLLASSPHGQFSTYDRDILHTFGEFLRQRVVDFNREWKHLALCFPEDMVQRLLQDSSYQARLAPVEKDVAILYTDISGFTRLSEQVLKEPPLIGKLVNTWSERAVEIIWSTGGVFDKMVGDCLIGLWGPPYYPYEPGEACYRAADAAQQISAFTRELSNHPALPELAKVDFPVGVATGLNYCPLFVGQFGPNEDFTGFSSGMNNTARLQGVAERDEILCMTRFVEELGDRAQFGPDRNAKVKNVAEPIEFQALLELRN